MWHRRFLASLCLPSVVVGASLASACQGHAPEPNAQRSSELKEAWAAQLVLGSWREVVAPYPLLDHTATALDDGRILVAGGEPLEGDEGMLGGDTAFLFTPGDDTWTQLPSMNEPRMEHSATKLSDGRVLVFGGKPEYFATTYSNTSEIFDPVTSTWTQVVSTPQMGRSFPGAVLLPDGNVLLVGGYDETGVTGNVDIFDPSVGPTGSWNSGPAIVGGRARHTTLVLPSGAVLVSGGHDAGWGMVDSNLELADPYTGSWAELSPLAEDRQNHTATLLPDGRVLIAGGVNSMEQVLNSVEIVSDTVTSAAPMLLERAGHTAALLPDGRVIVVGGENMNGQLETTEIYDPQTDQWSLGPSLNVARAYHQMVVVPGRLVVLGGRDSMLALDSVEILEFTGSLGTPCAADVECASGYCVDGVCCDTACEGACVACTVELKGAGVDGRCESVVEGTNPRSLCEDEGAASCGTTGVCDANGSCAVYENGTTCGEGMTCQAGVCASEAVDCTGLADGVVCSESDGCTLGLCRDGLCVETYKLDGTRCEGGVCIAGECRLDREATPPSGVGGDGPGSNDDDPNAVGPGAQDPSGAADGDGDGGGGCSVAPSASSSSFAMGFALLAAVGLLRRHGNIAR